MKAALIRSFGSADVISLEDLPLPEPRDDEALIRVYAASINPVDYKIRSGGYVSEDNLPVVLGRDVAGIVERCGPSMTRFRQRDPVFAMLDNEHGGYAEYVIVREGDLARKPTSLDYTEAAAVPLAAMTAWQGLFDHGDLQPGQRILIHGGAGGVGHFAIQFAKNRGAMVFTTVSGDDFDLARELGADVPIDYRKQRFEDVAKDIDFVFDLVGDETQERSWAVLKPGGTMISTLARPSEQRAQECSVRASNFMVQRNAAELERIGQLIDEGKVKPHIDAVRPLDDVRAAQQQLENEHVRGKVVLQVVA